MAENKNTEGDLKTLEKPEWMSEEDWADVVKVPAYMEL